MCSGSRARSRSRSPLPRRTSSRRSPNAIDRSRSRSRSIARAATTPDARSLTDLPLDVLRVIAGSLPPRAAARLAVTSTVMRGVGREAVAAFTERAVAAVRRARALARVTMFAGALEPLVVPALDLFREYLRAYVAGTVPLVPPADAVGRLIRRVRVPPVTKALYKDGEYFFKVSVTESPPAGSQAVWRWYRRWKVMPLFDNNVWYRPQLEGHEVGLWMYVGVGKEYGAYLVADLATRRIRFQRVSGFEGDPSMEAAVSRAIRRALARDPRF